MFTVVNRRSPQNRVRRAKGGFTLTELMIASLMTLGIMTIGGVAFSAMISASQKNESEGERRIELNRALAFVGAETQEASTINTDAVPTEFSPSSSEVNTSSVQSVLRLKISGLTKPVVYYLATPASANLKWRGPRVLYRWGPSYTTTGAYGTDKTTPSSWAHQPLIDGLESSASTPSCATGWTASPSSGATGFYACINSTNKVAQLFNKGRVTKVLGATSPYLLSSQAFARSSDTASPSQPFTITSNRVTHTVAASTGVQVLGSDIRCGSTASPMNTAFTISYQPPGGSTTTTAATVVSPTGSMPTVAIANQPTGTTFSFNGYIPANNPSGTNPNNTCSAQNVAGSGFNNVSNATQVVVLKDGDSVPSVGGFGGSLSAKQYLSSYLDNTGTKIKLPNPTYQYIILYELGTTVTSSSAFDQQDLVLMVTVTPT